MLDNKTNSELVEHVVANVTATPEELLLAERLAAAMEEIDRMQAMLAQAEVRDGQDA